MVALVNLLLSVQLLYILKEWLGGILESKMCIETSSQEWNFTLIITINASLRIKKREVSIHSINSQESSGHSIIRTGWHCTRAVW